MSATTSRCSDFTSRRTSTRSSTRWRGSRTTRVAGGAAARAGPRPRRPARSGGRAGWRSGTKTWGCLQSRHRRCGRARRVPPGPRGRARPRGQGAGRPHAAAPGWRHVATPRCGLLPGPDRRAPRGRGRLGRSRWARRRPADRDANAHERRRRTPPARGGGVGSSSGMKVAIVGGTGDFGLALAVRLVEAGDEVVIGSRDAERALEKAREVGAAGGAANDDAVTHADLVVLATKADGTLETAA